MLCLCLPPSHCYVPSAAATPAPLDAAEPLPALPRCDLSPPHSLPPRRRRRPFPTPLPAPPPPTRAAASCGCELADAAQELYSLRPNAKQLSEAELRKLVRAAHRGGGVVDSAAPGGEGGGGDAGTVPPRQSVQALDPPLFSGPVRTPPTPPPTR